MDPTSSLAPREKILEALLGIVAERGLDRATVREVAAAAGVAIGTVQHYFPTKDAMLSAAFTEMVVRVRGRVDAQVAPPDADRDLAGVMHELLPLDERRRNESRVHLAFAARAAVSSDLAAVQRAVLTGVHGALAAAFAAIWDVSADSPRPQLAARAALAVADGLALHAVSTDDWLDNEVITETLDFVYDALAAGRASSPGLRHRAPG